MFRSCGSGFCKWTGGERKNFHRAIHRLGLVAGGASDSKNTETLLRAFETGRHELHVGFGGED